jgi:DNA-binding NtrC family response regulator/tetratricopeptide (TPR) repeat protein
MARARPVSPIHPTDRILGSSPAIDVLRAQIRHLAPFDAVGHPSVPTVLLYGETGTGKGLVARIIHDSSPRSQGPFLDMNCAAIPEALLEAELFGYETGAFTDARHAKPGLFEAAFTGTLFLDEIDALPLPLQGKLLTAIEEKRVRRVGAVVAQAVDVKLIAATQAELSSHVAAGRFRADLYHRLAVIVLALPPLRERGDDVLLLAQQWLRQYAEGHGLPPKRLSGAAEAWLRDHRWPGNVRELSHLMERVTLLSDEAIIGPDTLERLGLPRTSPPPKSPLTSADRELPDEAARIAQALSLTGGNVLRAARLLGMSRDAVRYRMRKYGIALPFPQLSSPLAGDDADAESRMRRFSISTPILLPQSGEKAGGSFGPHPPGLPRDGELFVSTPGEPQASVPSLEQKPVAVLALELTWPVPAEGEAPRYEPWTATRRWEQTIVEKVQGFDGVLLQRSPSLFLVAFGVPRTLEQLPQRAVQAALALRQVVDATPVGGLCPQLRQAVHWGPLVVDAEARDSMGQLLAIGDTLARPVRLLGHTAPGEILVSPEVAPVIENWCALQACERPFRVEPAEQIGAYAVLGLRPRHSPLEMYAQRSLSRFVGRERELAALGDLLVQVEEGRGQVVGIMGEPGIGKSRVCYEFTRTHLTHGWLRLDTSAASYGKGIPYLPVIDLLKAYFQVDAGDDRQTIQVKVTDKLLALETTLEPILPALLVLLGVPVEDPPWQALDPSQRRQRLLDAVNHLWLRESQVQPLCLIVENLHWIDGETQACLDSFVESLPAARVLLLVSYRPDYQHGWTSKTYYTQLRLDPLPSASAYALAHAILGHDPSVRPLTPRLIERTEGNPLFLEESIQTLVETQVLSGERGAYRLAKAWQPMQVPATVHMVLAARIDRLPVEAKRLLQIAAVIGKDVPFSLLQAIGERPAEALRQVVAHLQRAEFLYERSLFPELAYTFKHALTHEVTYGSLQQEQRRALHARIIEAIEALDANGLGEQVERLAHHALRGEMWEKAVTYCRQAGARAHDRAAFREAVTAFEQALQALVYLPEDGDTRVLAIEIRLALAHALRGDHGRKRALMGEAATLARALDDWGRVGRVLAAMAEQLVVTGDFDGAIAAGQEALELATALGDRALQGQASTRLGQAYNAIGAHGRAAELLCWSVEAVDREAGTSSVASRIDARALLVLTLGDLGAFAEGRRYGEEALRLATVEGRGIDPMNARSRLGRLYLAQGDLEHAIPVLEQGVALCRASGDWSQLRPTVASLGYAYALLGRLAEGRTLLEEGIREGIRIGGVGNHARWVAWLSEVCRLAGRGEEAYQHARQALDLAQRLKARGDEALALHQLGVVQAHADPPDAAQAEALLQQAMAMADELGMRPLLAHCHLGLGTLYAKIGRREPAGASLSTAIELYRIMDMTFWLPQAEATLAQVE